MKKNNFDKIFNEISNYYDERIIKYKDTPKSVGQKNIETLEKRLSILLEVGNLKNLKFLILGVAQDFFMSF